MSSYGNNRSYLRRKSRNLSRNVRGYSKCLNCGSDEDVTIHHENGNLEDNSLGNLVALCRKCHNELHRIEKKN